MNKQKLENLRNWMAKNNMDVAYVSEPTHVAYFSGHVSDPHERILALFVPLEADPFLFTPALEVEDAKHAGFSYDVVGYQDSENPWAIIADELKKRVSTIKHFAIEKNSLPVRNYEALKYSFDSALFDGDLTPCIEEMLLIKSETEKQLMMEAGDWADFAFEVGFNAIKNGAKEFDIVAEIEYQLKRKGVSKMSFDTIVLAGANAASPHGVPSDNTVKPNELVLFDLGVIWKNYCSDASRTISYKEPTKFQEKIYNIVLEAQLAAQQAVKPGIKASELDKIARDVISSYGYGEYFNHRLGHGIGTTCHEFPSIVEGNDMTIREGMCFSIEPGIYIPNEVGVRIEDCVFVTKDGCVPFTKTPKELKIIE